MDHTNDSGARLRTGRNTRSRRPLTDEDVDQAGMKTPGRRSTTTKASGKKLTRERPDNVTEKNFVPTWSQGQTNATAGGSERGGQDNGLDVSGGRQEEQPNHPGTKVLEEEPGGVRLIPDAANAEGRSQVSGSSRSKRGRKRKREALELKETQRDLSLAREDDGIPPVAVVSGDSKDVSDDSTAPRPPESSVETSKHPTKRARKRQRQVEAKARAIVPDKEQDSEMVSTNKDSILVPDGIKSTAETTSATAAGHDSGNPLSKIPSSGAHQVVSAKRNGRSKMPPSTKSLQGPSKADDNPKETKTVTKREPKGGRRSRKSRVTEAPPRASQDVVGDGHVMEPSAKLPHAGSTTIQNKDKGVRPSTKNQSTARPVTNLEIHLGDGKMGEGNKPEKHLTNDAAAVKDASKMHATTARRTSKRPRRDGQKENQEPMEDFHQPMIREA